MTLQFSGPTTVSLSIIPIFLSFMRHVFATRDHKPLCFNILYYRGSQVIFSKISNKKRRQVQACLRFLFFNRYQITTN